MQEIVKNRKRTEASKAIIKDIEKRQAKPTNAMLLALFGESLVRKKTRLVELKFMDKPREEKQIDTTVPKIRYEQSEDKMQSVKQDFSHVLDNVKVVKGSFGKPYLKLEITGGLLERFKRTLKNPIN